MYFEKFIYCGSSKLCLENIIITTVFIHLIISNTQLQGGSNMTGTDLYVNKPHCAAAVRP